MTMRLLLIDTKPNNPNRYIVRAVFDALRRNPKLTKVISADYTDAISSALNNKFDALIAFDGEEADNAIIHRLCSIIPRRAIWFTEDPYEFNRNKDIANLFDLVLSNDATTAQHYTPPAVHMPLAADRNRHFRPITDEAALYDVFFAGSAWPNRLDFLLQVRRARPRIRLKTILVTNPALDPHLEPWRTKFRFSPAVSIEDFCHLANQSLMTLTLPRRFSADVSRFEASSDTPGPRLFEVAAAGSCQLVDVQTTPIAASLFDSANQFLSFSSFEECLSRIDDALANPARTRAMAAAAQKQAWDHHLYDHRVASLVDRLLALPAQKGPKQTPSRRKILFVTHNTIENGNYGGSEIVLKEVQNILSEFDSWTLTFDHHDHLEKKYILIAPDGSVKETFYINTPQQIGNLTNTDIENIFQDILDQNGFSVVVFNHLLRYPISLPILAKIYGAKTIYYLHDYYMVCENFNLIDDSGGYCDVTSRPEHDCDSCLAATHHMPAGSQTHRRNYMRKAIDAFDVIICSSIASQTIILSIFPNAAKRIQLVPLPAFLRHADTTKSYDSPALTVGILGNFTQAKGADTALAVMKQCLDRPILFHLFGRIDDHYVGMLDTLSTDKIIRHGSYSGTLPAAFAQCHVGLFLSPWPETFCITLSEAQSCGVVPIVTNLGAQAERVRDGEDGLLVPVGDADAVCRALERLQDRTYLHQLASAQPSSDQGEYSSAIINIVASMLQDHPDWDCALSPSRRLSLSEFGILPPFPQCAMPSPATLIATLEADYKVTRDLTKQQATQLSEKQFEIEKLNQQLNFLKEAFREISDSRQEILFSTSWKLSLPLRAVAHILKTFVGAILRPTKCNSEITAAMKFIKWLMEEKTRIVPKIDYCRATIRSKGIRFFSGLIVSYFNRNEPHSRYFFWRAEHEYLSSSDIRLMQERATHLPLKPTFSIIIPVYNTPDKWLRRALDSVLEQTWPYWELCIADDNSSLVSVKTTLQEYSRRDSRIKVSYRTINGHISAASNSALDLATGDFVTLLDHDDELTRDALFQMALEINAHPDAKMIYSDEDKIDEEGFCFDPYFKSDWNIDLLLSHNMICHFVAYETTILKNMGGFRIGYEGSQDYDLTLRYSQNITRDQIRHVPQILYHWRTIPGSTALGADQKTYPYDAARRAIADYVRSNGTIGAKIVEAFSFTGNRVIYPLPTPTPQISIVIIETGDIQEIITCIKKMVTATNYEFYEIIVLARSDDFAFKLLTWIDTDFSLPESKIHCVFLDDTSSMAASLNQAVTHCAGSIIVFLANNAEIIVDTWLQEFASQAMRAEIGVIGGQIADANGRIMHAGMAFHPQKFVINLFDGLASQHIGYFGKSHLLQNVSAVSGCFMAIRKDTFNAVGGFDATNFPHHLYDADLCLRLGEHGRLITYSPYAQIRLASTTLPDMAARDANTLNWSQAEATFRQRWPAILAHDPYLSPNLEPIDGGFTVATPPRSRKRFQ